LLQVKKVNKKTRRCVKIPKNENTKAKSFKLLLLASEALAKEDNFFVR
jgi:hypothetical protein